MLTLPVVRTVQRRVGAISTFIVAITVQGVAVILFADARAAIVGPLIYCLFLLSNSAAAASLNGARAAEVEHDHQGLLNMALMTVGMIGFITGRAHRSRSDRTARLRRRPPDHRLGHGRHRRCASVGRSWRRRPVLDLLITGATVYPGDAPPFVGDVGVAGDAIDLVTNCHED